MHCAVAYCPLCVRLCVSVCVRQRHQFLGGFQVCNWWFVVCTVQWPPQDMTCSTPTANQPSLLTTLHCPADDHNDGDDDGDDHGDDHDDDDLLCTYSQPTLTTVSC